MSWWACADRDETGECPILDALHDEYEKRKERKT
jgi:hypothetical protein